MQEKKREEREQTGFIVPKEKKKQEEWEQSRGDSTRAGEKTRRAGTIEG
ncbi:hypothetical protein [Neobacillus niacini]|nr:hypothetical protein [Neobacillus niacini]MDR7002021.1 hypothetical protein [Neobacillus niacini]